MNEARQMRRRATGDDTSELPPAGVETTPETLQRFQQAHRTKWQKVGVLGFVLMLMSFTSICILAYVEHWSFFDILQQQDSSQSSINSLPPFFDEQSVPLILLQYAKHHKVLSSNPHQKTSKFLVYEISSQNTTIFSESFLGLTSAFLFAILTDRALMIRWDTGSQVLQKGDWTNNTVHLSNLPIDAILQDPSFNWNYDKFMAAIETDHVYSNDPSAWQMHDFDVRQQHERISCEDLKTTLPQKVIRIVAEEYFAPLLIVNPYYSSLISTQLGSSIFEPLFNFLIRPAPSVFNAIRQFKERYFSGYAVISMQMQLHEQADRIMSSTHQKLFFQTATLATNRAAEATDPDAETGVMVFVVTDDRPLLMEELQSIRQTAFGAAGVVAITGMASSLPVPAQSNEVTAHLSSESFLPDKPSAYRDADAERDPATALLNQVHTELQQLWLLGEAQTIITTPGSVFGVIAHARVGVAPIVVIDDELAHPSTSSQPCLADFGLVQYCQCFRPSMLSLVPQDPIVPC